MSTKLSSCCLSGHLHKGTPEGKVKEIAGLQAYISGTNTEKQVVIISDVFGWELPNVRLVADEYAKQGNFKVLVPDFFGNDAVNPDHMKVLTPLASDNSMTEEERGATMGKIFPSEIQPWLGRQSDVKVNSLFAKVFSTLREQGAKKIGVVGFCWGGRHALIQAGLSPSPVDAVVANHPSFTEFPDVYEKVNAPTLIQIGDNDSFFPYEQVEKVRDEIFKGKENASLTVLPGARHGFAVRNDQNNDEEVKQKEESTKATIIFLSEHL